MAAVSPLPPTKIKELLERSGYKIVEEDSFHWAMANEDSDDPILVPKQCDFVPLEVAFHVATLAGFSKYFEFLNSGE